MKITIPVELDLTMQSEVSADELNVSQREVDAVITSPEFKQHLAHSFQSNEDIWATIDNYLEDMFG